jgi:hypothetical protein
LTPAASGRETVAMLKPPPGPRLTEPAAAAQRARSEREAEALRANLLRRKQQQRARAAESPANASGVSSRPKPG